MDSKIWTGNKIKLYLGKMKNIENKKIFKKKQNDKYWKNPLLPIAIVAPIKLVIDIIIFGTM